MTRITEAASKHDLPTIESLTRAASDLEEIKEKVTQIGARLSRVNPDAVSQRPTTSNAGFAGSILREFTLQVTDGAIRQNLFTMTEQLKRGAVKPEEEFTIEALRSGERFKTVLLASGNKLQERGAVSRFYRDAHVRGGDYVLLSEIGPVEWTLKKSPRSNNGHS